MPTTTITKGGSPTDCVVASVARSVASVAFLVTAIVASTHDRNQAQAREDIGGHFQPRVHGPVSFSAASDRDDLDEVVEAGQVGGVAGVQPG